MRARRTSASSDNAAPKPPLFKCIAWHYVRHVICFTPTASHGGAKWCSGKYVQDSDRPKNAAAKPCKRPRKPLAHGGNVCPQHGQPRFQACLGCGTAFYQCAVGAAAARGTEQRVPRGAQRRQHADHAGSDEERQAAAPSGPVPALLPVWLVKTMADNTNKYARLHKATERARKWWAPPWQSCRDSSPSPCMHTTSSSAHRATSCSGPTTREHSTPPRQRLFYASSSRRLSFMWLLPTPLSPEELAQQGAAHNARHGRR